MSITLETENIHPSALLALEALQWLHPREEFNHILDMGCGNGVLSLTAAHLWPAQILAVDIAPKAIADTSSQIAAYSMEDRVSALRSDRFAHPDIGKNGPYDLIIANMLDNWLVEMARDIQKNLAPGGTILLSGMLGWLAGHTLQTYTELGFEIKEELSMGDWRSCILKAKL